MLRERIDPAPLVFLIVALCIVNEAGLALRLSNALTPQGQDTISVSIARFRSLAAALPERATVGYLADDTEGTFDPALAWRITAANFWQKPLFTARYILTQYALAPVTVLDSRQPALIIGNFSSPERAQAMIASFGLQVIQDCGQGLYLLKHGGQR